MLRILQDPDPCTTRLRLSGRIQSADLDNLWAEMALGCDHVALDLRDVTLVDLEVVRFLGRCEKEGVLLEHCPAYVREWILRERDEGGQSV